MPGLSLRRLRLHRHLPEADALADHRHPFAQIICYVAGRGVVRVNNRRIEIGSGSVVYIPKNLLHGFTQSVGRRPLTLAIDFTAQRARRNEFGVATLSRESLAELKLDLSRLAKMPPVSQGTPRVFLAATSLGILARCLHELSWFASPRPQSSPHVRAFDRVLAQPEALGLPIHELAARAGFDPVYLGRRVKAVTGLTLQERRDARRLEQARRLLQSGVPVRSTGESVGILDQNYFARWFKAHTGIQPRVYAQRAGVR